MVVAFDVRLELNKADDPGPPCRELEQGVMGKSGRRGPRPAVAAGIIPIVPIFIPLTAVMGLVVGGLGKGFVPAAATVVVVVVFVVVGSG